MQKKKYLFSLAILVICLVGVFRVKIEANAFTEGATCCINDVSTPATCSECVAADGSDCILSAMGGSCPSVALCTDSRCTNGLNTNLLWCCDDTTAKKCTSIVENGTCANGVAPYKDVCDNVSTCKAYSINGGNGENSTTISFINPITSNSVDEVLTSLMKALSGLVVTLAIIFIVLGGILYMMSAGDPGMIKRAKDCWLFSVIGLAIVIAAPTFLKQVQIILGGNLTGGGIENALTIGEIATNVLNFLLSLVGIIAIISLVVAGGMYMTAYGDDTQIGKAKKIFTWSIAGIVVALVSLVAVQQIEKLITG